MILCPRFVFATGILVDKTGSYSIPFYIAGAGFLMCSLLLLIRPISQKYFTKSIDTTSKEAHCHENANIELDGTDAEHSI